jgi:hypothetical protein
MFVTVLKLANVYILYLWVNIEILLFVELKPSKYSVKGYHLVITETQFLSTLNRKIFVIGLSLNTDNCKCQRLKYLKPSVISICHRTQLIVNPCFT